MTTRGSAASRRLRGIGPAFVFAALAAAIILAVAAALWRRGPGPAVVMATVEDCRRAFDDASCRAIVARAQAVHAATAPSFATRAPCELVYGAGACAPLRQENVELHLYAPTLALIATDRSGATVLPLYFGPARAALEERPGSGRLVYYHGAAVGRFLVQRIGGAELPALDDLSGAPMTAAALRKLRASP